MNKNIVALALACASVAAVGMEAPVRAQVGKNAIGPALSIGGGSTTLGIDSRFGVNESLSIRPFLFFPSGGTVFGSSLTYDFDTSRNSRILITPFVGGGVAIGNPNGGGPSTTTVYFTGGADFGVSDSVDLRAALDVPLSSNNSTTSVRLGAGFKF